MADASPRSASKVPEVDNGLIVTTRFPPEHKGEKHRINCDVYLSGSQTCNCDQGLSGKP